MKCERVKSIMVLAVFSVSMFGISAAVVAEQLPTGWIAAGSHPQDYEMKVDPEVAHDGEGSGYIGSKVVKAEGFGTLMQMFKADTFRGKRVRMSAYVKAAKIEDWAGVWMRIDGPGQRALGFDNMQKRPIKGTVDWKKYEVVLDVPESSVGIAFGILVTGKGRAWIDDIEFEVVGKDVPTTGELIPKTPKAELPPQPVNLDFED